MSSKKEPLTMESVQQDMQCLRKVFSMVRLVKATQPKGRDTASTLGLRHVTMTAARALVNSAPQRAKGLP